MTPRAAPLSPEDRRAQLVAVTLPLLLEHGRAVTTRRIAEAAGVAEGTIFRVFADKDELLDAAADSAFDLEPYIRSVETMSGEGGLDDVLTRLAQHMIDRFQHVFRLFTVLGIKGPPPHRHPEGWTERIGRAHARLLEPFADELTLPPREVMRYVRLLAFSGSNPHITDGETLTADQIVRLVLDGTRKAR